MPKQARVPWEAIECSACGLRDTLVSHASEKRDSGCCVNEDAYIDCDQCNGPCKDCFKGALRRAKANLKRELKRQLARSKKVKKGRVKKSASQCNSVRRSSKRIKDMQKKTTVTHRYNLRSSTRKQREEKSLSKRSAQCTVVAAKSSKSPQKRTVKRAKTARKKKKEVRNAIIILSDSEDEGNAMTCPVSPPVSPKRSVRSHSRKRMEVDSAEPKRSRKRKKKKKIDTSLWTMDASPAVRSRKKTEKPATQSTKKARRKLGSKRRKPISDDVSVLSTDIESLFTTEPDRSLQKKRVRGSGKPATKRKHKRKRIEAKSTDIAPSSTAKKTCVKPTKLSKAKKRARKNKDKSPLYVTPPETNASMMRPMMDDTLLGPNSMDESVSEDADQAYARGIGRGMGMAICENTMETTQANARIKSLEAENETLRKSLAAYEEAWTHFAKGIAILQKIRK